MGRQAARIFPEIAALEPGAIGRALLVDDPFVHVAGHVVHAEGTDAPGHRAAGHALIEAEHLVGDRTCLPERLEIGRYRGTVDIAGLWIADIAVRIRSRLDAFARESPLGARAQTLAFGLAGRPGIQPANHHRRQNPLLVRVLVAVDAETLVDPRAVADGRLLVALTAVPLSRDPVDAALGRVRTPVAVDKQHSGRAGAGAVGVGVGPGRGLRILCRRGSRGDRSHRRDLGRRRGTGRRGCVEAGSSRRLDLQRAWGRCAGHHRCQ